MEYIRFKKNSADWLSREPLPDSVHPTTEEDLTIKVCGGK